MKVLVIDDDPRLREALQVGLQLQWQDADMVVAADGETGLERFFQEEPDVVLLDVSMPRMNGFEVLKEIRRVSDTPVIMLTARGEDVDQVRGLGLGADDHVPEPFTHLALMARIKAVLRRAEMPPPVESLPDFVAGDLAVHFQNQDVSVAGQSVKLTPVEYKLLYHLVRNARHLLSHQALLDRVWGPEYDPGPEYLKVFISRLRAKLADRERRSTSGPNATEAIALSARLTHWPKTVSRVSSWRVPAAADAPPGRVGNTTRRRAPRDDHRVGHDHPTGYGRSVQATASSAQNSCTCLEVRR